MAYITTSFTFIYSFYTNGLYHDYRRSLSTKRSFTFFIQMAYITTIFVHLQFLYKWLISRLLSFIVHETFIYIVFIQMAYITTIVVHCPRNVHLHFLYKWLISRLLSFIYSFYTNGLYHDYCRSLSTKRSFTFFIQMAYITTIVVHLQFLYKWLISRLLSFIVHETFIYIFYTNGLYHDYCRSFTVFIQMAYITTIVVHCPRNVHLHFLYKWLISRLLSFIYSFYTNGLYHDYCRSLSTKRSVTFFIQMAYITTIVVHLQFLYKWLISRLLSFIVHETFIYIFYTNGLYHDYCRSFTVFIQMAYITTIVVHCPRNVHLHFLYKWLISRLLSFIYSFYTNGLYHDYCRSLSTKRSFTFFIQMAYITTIVVHLQFLYKWLISRLLSFIVHETFIYIFYTNGLYHDYCRSFTVFIQMAYITTIVVHCPRNVHLHFLYKWLISRLLSFIYSFYTNGLYHDYCRSLSTKRSFTFFIQMAYITTIVVHLQFLYKWLISRLLSFIVHETFIYIFYTNGLYHDYCRSFTVFIQMAYITTIVVHCPRNVHLHFLYKWLISRLLSFIYSFYTNGLYHDYCRSLSTKRSFTFFIQMAYITTIVVHLQFLYKWLISRLLSFIVHETFIYIFYTNGLYHDYCRSFTVFIQMAYITTIVVHCPRNVHLHFLYKWLITTIVVHLQFLYKWLISRLLSFIVHETFIYIFYTNGLYHDYCRSFRVFIQMAYITTIVVHCPRNVHLHFLYKWLISRLLSFIYSFYTNGLYHDYCRSLSTKRSFTFFIQMAYITTIVVHLQFLYKWLISRLLSFIVHETFIYIFYTNGLYHDYCRSFTVFIQMAYITTIVVHCPRNVHLHFLYKWLISRLLSFIYSFYTNGLYHDYCRSLSTKRSFTFFIQMAYITTIVVHLQFLYKWLISRLLSFIVHETFIYIFYTNGLYHDYCRSFTVFIQMAYITTIVVHCPRNVHLHFLYKWLISRLLSFIYSFYTNGLYHDYCRSLSTKRSFTFFIQMAYITTIVLHLVARTATHAFTRRARVLGH